jgi:DNA-binding transcriptional ArsR family regulator
VEVGVSRNSIGDYCSAQSPKQTHTDSQRLAVICKALAHPVRIQIIAHLKGMDHCVCGQLVEALPLAQSTVSQHLKILKTAGLIKGEVEGPRTCYCINPDVMEEFRSLIARI